MSRQQYNTTLAQALCFTEDDLAANRQGRFSPHQIQLEQARRTQTQARAQQAAGRAPMLVVYYVIILIVLAGIFVFTGALQAVQAALGPAAIPVLIGVALVLLLIIATVPARSRRAAERASAQASGPLVLPVVQTVAGPVRAKTAEIRDETVQATYHYIIAEGQKISVSKPIMQAFVSGKRYQLFYVESGRSKRLLSAEALED